MEHQLTIMGDGKERARERGALIGLCSCGEWHHRAGDPDLLADLHASHRIAVLHPSLFESIQ